MKQIGILAFSDGGRRLSSRIYAELAEQRGMREARAQHRNVSVYDSGRETSDNFVKRYFRSGDALVFIGAAGIAVRKTAPYIRSKDRDPAVVVIDEKGRFVIPILSGHMGGANDLARELAVITGGEAVITTGTDVNGLFAVDLWAAENECSISDIKKIRNISGAILRRDTVEFDPGEFSITGDVPGELTVKDREEQTCSSDRPENGICVSLSGDMEEYANTLNLVPRIITLGAGCRRGTGSEDFEAFVLKKLDEAHMSIRAVKAVATVELKKNEKCLNDFCRKYNIELKTYTADELMAAEGDFHHSDFVEKTTGADNICERAACADGSRLIIARQTGNGMTMAAARSEWDIRFTDGEKV